MPDLPAGAWNAHWIALSADPREDLGIFGFRRSFELSEIPKELKVRMSADQRYKLYVNGQFVGFGPQRGDPNHWFYETYDLAPFLNVGKNWIAALVWNFGRWAPMAQMSSRTGFVLEGLHPPAPSSVSPGGKTREGESLSTPNDWQVARLSNWGFDMIHSEAMDFYIDIGPGEIIDFRNAPWGWRTGEDTPNENRQTTNDKPTRDLDQSGMWRKPNVICRAEERGTMGGGTPWMLIPRSIPPMLYEERLAPPKVRRGFLGDAPDPVELKEGTPLPTDFRLLPDHLYLLDYEELLTAYPRLTLSGPRGAVVTLTYAEGLWRKEGGKGNRDEVVGKKMSGYQDRIILDGETRTIEPLWWRTYRYLMIEAKSPSLEGGEGVGSRQAGEMHSSTPTSPSKEGIVLHHLAAIETGYPIKEESSFTADEPSVQPIWDVSVRTAKRCAGETYFDCPYYEQLQYVGDTRIQALIGYYLGRDRALTRNAVETLGWSLMENGLTQSRYPSRQTQVIPPFSLWWVMMVYDQLLYDRLNNAEAWTGMQSKYEFDNSWEGAPGLDSRLCRRMSSVTEAWDSLSKTNDKSFWNFCDWVPLWNWGVPPGNWDSEIHKMLRFLAIVASRHYVMLCTWPDGYKGSAQQSARELDALIDSTLSHQSEHGDGLIRLGQSMVLLDPDPWPTEALAKANAAKCTYYFSYYKHLAMFGRPEHEEGDKSDWSDRSDRSDRSNTTYKSYPFEYLTELQPWKEMIEEGLSTFAENPEPTRSDCHAWSAHPILGFFQIVAGVTSTAPGWKRAQIMPHPGSLRRFDARIAHPDGELRVGFDNGKLWIDSPIPFELRWKGKREERKAGKHEISG